MNKKKFWIVNKINLNTAQILIYGFISPYEVSAADFLIELTQLAATFNTIQIRINSGGGSVFEGIAIRSAIKSFIKAGINVVTYVDGIAASMAAPLAISGSKVYISKFGRMMFHKASGYGEGSADDLRRTADMMDGAEKDILQMITDKTGLPAKDIEAKLFQPGIDKWLSAQECIDMKLADEIFDAEEVDVPENTTNAKELVNLFDTILNKTTTIKNSYNMKKDLLKKLNLPENATDDQIDAAVEKSLTEKQTAEETIAINNKKNIEGLIDQAITDKKLVSADKEGWVKNFENNLGGLQMALAKLTIAKKPTEVIQNRTQNLSEGEDEAEVKGWDALVKKGKDAITKCREETPDVYNKLYTEKYHRSPEAMGFSKT